MNSNWIEFGGCIALIELVIAVGEIQYEKYDETYNYTVYLADGSLRSTSMNVTDKNKEVVEESHTILKRALMARSV